MVDIIKVSSEQEFEKVLALRFEVFVDEQGVPPEIERDEADGNAVHVLAQKDRKPVGCGRVEIDGKQAKIGRMAVRKSYRDQGIGSGICRKLIELASQQGCEKVVLHAQLTARRFYEKQGFKARGSIFTEAGINHIKMILEL